MEYEDQDVELCHSYPIIYKVEIEQDCFDEVIQLFIEDILQGIPYSRVESAIVNYITSVIEPVGWKAVWRSTQTSLESDIECDFVVEVMDVSRIELKADVVIKSIIVPKVCTLDLSAIQNKVCRKKTFTVPLIELYAISDGDDEEIFAKTAVAIEHARLFYDHLCRPWDCDDDIYYTEKILMPRLQLYFDIQHKSIPEIMMNKIKAILHDGWDKVNELKTYYSELNINDFETELNEDDVLKIVELRKQLENLQRKMETFEDPLLRTLMMKQYVPQKSPQKPLDDGGPFTYVVGEQFTYEAITMLNLDPKTVLKFDHSPERALKSCVDGDRVLILPGKYRCDSLGWLDGKTIVKGIGSIGSVQLEATGNSEVFLNCDSPSVVLENLSLTAASGIVSMVVVHHGTLVMKNCTIHSDEAETGLTVLGGSEVILEESEVCNAKEDGIQLKSASIFALKSSRVVSCYRHGINIDADEEANLAGQVTEISILDSYIVNNDGHGIYVNTVPQKEGIYPAHIEHDNISLLNLLPWLKHKIGNVHLRNKLSDIGFASASLPVRNIEQSKLGYFRSYFAASIHKDF